MIGLTYEQKKRNRFLKQLKTTQASDWDCLGVLGVPREKYPNSLYKLWLRRKGSSGRWWNFQFGFGQAGRSVDPIKDQRRREESGASLPDHRIVEGDLSALDGIICDPMRPGLLWVLGIVGDHLDLCGEAHGNIA